MDEKTKRNYNVYLKCVSLNNDLQKSKFTNNVLSYDELKVDLTNVDLDAWYRENENNIKKFTSRDFIKSVEIFEKRNKKSIDIENVKEALETIEEVNPEIRNISVISLNDGSGVKKDYVHFFDKDGNDYILYKYAPTDILRVYNDLIANKGTSRIDAKTIYEELKNKMENVELYNEETLYNEEDTNIDYLSALGIISMKNFDSKKDILGNEKMHAENESAAVIDDNKVASIEENSKGELTYKEWGNNGIENEESVEFTEPALVNDKKYIPTLKEFIRLISIDGLMDSKEEELFLAYFDHILDLMQRENDLSYEEKKEYDEYILLIESIAISEEKTHRHHITYEKHLEISELAKKNTKKVGNTLVLKYKGYNYKNNKAGAIGPVVIVALVILIGIFLALLIIK